VVRKPPAERPTTPSLHLTTYKSESVSLILGGCFGADLPYSVTPTEENALHTKSDNGYYVKTIGQAQFLSRVREIRCGDALVSILTPWR
jgi:hypothetical protein